MPRPKAPPPRVPQQKPPHHNWWRTALLAAALSTGLYVYLGPREPQLGRHALVLFVAVYVIVWFCNPLQFFRRMSWVALLLVGGVILVHLFHTKGYFGPDSSATFVIAHTPWLVGVFTGAAILFAVLEYLQHRSPPNEDAVGEEISRPEPRPRKRRGDDLPKFPPPAPFKRSKRIPDQQTLSKVVEHCATRPPSTEILQVSVRMLRSEQDRVLDRLDAALSRVDEAAQSGDAEAKSAAQTARDTLDIEPLQAYLVAEADRRGYKTREDATAYLAVCREIAGVAELRGDWSLVRSNLEEVIRLVPEDVDAFCRLGRACLLLNKLVDAETAYQRVLTLSTDDEWRTMAFTNLGTVHLLQSDFSEAERVFDRALELDEALGDVKGMAANYANLGSVCRQRGNLGKAEKMFAMALEIDEGLELAQAKAG